MIAGGSSPDSELLHDPDRDVDWTLTLPLSPSLPMNRCLILLDTMEKLFREQLHPYHVFRCHPGPLFESLAWFTARDLEDCKRLVKYLKLAPKVLPVRLAAFEAATAVAAACPVLALKGKSTSKLGTDAASSSVSSGVAGRDAASAASNGGCDTAAGSLYNFMGRTGGGCFEPAEVSVARSIGCILAPSIRESPPLWDVALSAVKGMGSEWAKRVKNEHFQLGMSCGSPAAMGAVSAAQFAAATAHYFAGRIACGHPLIDLGPDFVKDPMVPAAAAAVGDIGVLSDLAKAGWPLGEEACCSAAENGHFHVLQWLRARDPPCPWDTRTCSRAGLVGHLDMLRWAKEQGAPMDVETVQLAAFGGKLEAIKYARSVGCPWDEITTSYAAAKGHLEVLEHLLDNGAPHGKETCAAAAFNNRLSVVQWLRRRGVAWDETVCSAAAESGRLELLRWLRDHGCPWDARVYARACMHGHMDILEYARAHGCPADKTAATMAANHGQTKVLAWLRAHGFPE